MVGRLTFWNVISWQRPISYNLVKFIALTSLRRIATVWAWVTDLNKKCTWTSKINELNKTYQFVGFNECKQKRKDKRNRHTTKLWKKWRMVLSITVAWMKVVLPINFHVEVFQVGHTEKDRNGKKIHFHNFSWNLGLNIFESLVRYSTFPTDFTVSCAAVVMILEKVWGYWVLLMFTPNGLDSALRISSRFCSCIQISVDFIQT